MKKWLSALILGVAVLGVVTPASADSTADNARVETLMRQAGYNFEKKADGVWVIPQHGTNLGDFKVIVANGDGLEVIFVIFAKKNQMTMSTTLAGKMLHMNHEYDRVKVGIDDDGDAFVRDDANLRVLDAAEMKDDIHQVASSADEIYGVLKSYLN